MATRVITDLVTIEPNDLYQGGQYSTSGTSNHVSPSQRRFKADPSLASGGGNYSFVKAMNDAIAALPASGGTLMVHPVSGSTPYPIDSIINITKPLRLIFAPGALTRQTAATNYGFLVTARCKVENLQFSYDVTNAAIGRSLFRLSNTTVHQAVGFELSGGYASLCQVNSNIQRYMLVNAFGLSSGDRTPGIDIHGLDFIIRNYQLDTVTPGVQNTTDWVGTVLGSLNYGIGLLYAQNYRGIRVHDNYLHGEIEGSPLTYCGCLVVFEDCLYTMVNSNVWDSLHLSGSTAFKSLPLVAYMNGGNEGGHASVLGNWAEVISARSFVMAEDPQWLKFENNMLGRWGYNVAAVEATTGGRLLRVCNNSTHNMSGYTSTSDGTWDADPGTSQFTGTGIEAGRYVGEYIQAKDWTTDINKLTYRVTSVGSGVIGVKPPPPDIVVNSATAKLVSHSAMISASDVAAISKGGNDITFRNSYGPVYIVPGCKRMVTIAPDLVEDP